MMSDVVSMWCWIIFGSSIATASMAVAGLVAKLYQETLLENIGMVMIALSGFITALQILVHGFAQLSGLAFQAFSMAFYSTALTVKNWRTIRRMVSQ